MAEQCAAGARHEEALKNLGEGFVSHKKSNEHDFDRAFDLIETVRNRLPNWAVFVIAGLTTICGSLLTVLVTTS